MRRKISCCNGAEIHLLYYSPAALRFKCGKCGRETALHFPPYPFVLGGSGEKKQYPRTDEGLLEYCKTLERELEVIKNGDC